ncbi:winged helix-turn-helix domain-containing protein [Kaarinaea lacus]
MKNSHEKGFVIEDWHVSPAEGVLLRDNDTLRLEPKVMDVLVYFASRPGEVITREELERDVWRGALVGYDAVTATVIKLRKALGDSARQPHIIATIPKKGYQLIAPVTFVDNTTIKNTTTINSAIESTPTSEGADISQSTATPLDSGKTSQSNFKPAMIGAAILALVIIVAWLGVSQQQSQPSVDIPSLVVLPIENLGANDEHDVFVDGITEDIITDLSRLSNLMVFASNTSFKYKGRQVAAQELRDELNVDFMLKGSARRHGDEIRINMQLVNTETGFNVWAERFDRKLEEVFAVQDEVASSLVTALAIKLSADEKSRLTQRATNNLQAYEYFLEGQRLSKEYSRQANDQAMEAYKKAIASDPAYGRAYGALAYSLSLAYRRGWTDTPNETLDRAVSLAEQGVQLDSSIPQTWWSLGYVYRMAKEFEKAEQAASEAIRVAPNYADGYGLLALIHNSLGSADRALEYATRGMQLNPYYTWDYLFNVGFARYLLGNYPQAIEVLEKAQARNENAVPIKLFLAASYVQAGRIEDAEWIVEQLQVVNPESTLSHIDDAIAFANPDYKQKLLDDLRKAGMPE